MPVEPYFPGSEIRHIVGIDQFIIIFARIPLWEQETLVKSPVIVDVSQIKTCVQFVFFPA